MKILYEKANQFDEGFLKVSEIHNLYYAQYGTRKGSPLCFCTAVPAAVVYPLQVNILIRNFTELFYLTNAGRVKAPLFVK